MSIEDRLRSALAEAVATEPPPERSPFEQIARRRRRRPLIAATVALALLLVAAVAFTGIRMLEERPVRPTSTIVPPDWKESRDQEADLSFRYPPDWVVRTDLASAAYLVIVPAEFRDRRVTKSTELPFVVGVSGGGGGGGEGYYRIAAGEQAATGRLPNGRAYTEWTSVVNGRRYHDYSIDVGRVCTPGSSQPSCSAHSIRATLAADTAALMDRYRQVAMAIVGTLAPVSATTPSAGDRTRPPCRPDQWGFAPSPIWSFQGRSWIIEGQVRYPANGPACHLRVTLRVTVQRPDRTPMAVPGTPAPITIEGDLPEDRAPNDYPNSYGDVTTPLTWRWAWQNWCRQPTRPDPRADRGRRHRQVGHRAGTASGERQQLPGRRPGYPMEDLPVALSGPAASIIGWPNSPGRRARSSAPDRRRRRARRRLVVDAARTCSTCAGSCSLTTSTSSPANPTTRQAA